MAKNLSGKVKKIPSAQVTADRYEFLELAAAEPDLGVPYQNGYVLSSTTNGQREWIATPTSISYIVDYIGGGTSSGPRADIIYDAGANGSTITSWNNTIDAGASVASF